MEKTLIIPWSYNSYRIRSLHDMKIATDAENITSLFEKKPKGGGKKDTIRIGQIKRSTEMSRTGNLREITEEKRMDK